MPSKQKCCLLSIHAYLKFCFSQITVDAILCSLCLIFLSFYYFNLIHFLIVLFNFMISTKQVKLFSVLCIFNYVQVHKHVLFYMDMIFFCDLLHIINNIILELHVFVFFNFCVFQIRVCTIS